MRLMPGGFAWLVRHEVRVAWRGGSKAAKTRVQALLARAPLLLLATIPALVGTLLAWALRHLPGAPSPKLLAAFSVMFAALFLLMVFRAASQVLRSFNERGDLDLLLSAPIPRARVLAAKATGIYAAVGLPFMILLAPFIVASAVFGHWRWLGVLVMLGVASVLATSLAFVVARLLFRTMGVRRARAVIQVAGAALAGAAFLASQAVNFAPQSTRGAMQVLRALPPPFDWPARAAFGGLGLLLFFVALAAAAAWGATRYAAANFGEAAAAPVARQRTAPHRFRGGAMRSLIVKEWRLLGRDPELLSQVLLRLVYLVPVVLLIFRGDASGVFPAPRFAAAGTVFAGMLAASLAWLTVCAEDARDLIDAAPVRATTVARAKLLAACLPPLAVLAVPVLLLAARDAWAGIVLLAVGAFAAVTGATLQAWFGKPAPRSAFRRRQQGSLVLGVGELALAASWSGVAALLTRGSPWALAPLLLAATILAGANAAREASRGPRGAAIAA